MSDQLGPDTASAAAAEPAPPPAATIPSRLAVLGRLVHPRTWPAYWTRALWLLRQTIKLVAAAGVLWIAIVVAAVFFHISREGITAVFRSEHLASDPASQPIESLADALRLMFSSHAARDGLVAAGLALVSALMLLFGAIALSLGVYLAYRSYWTLKYFTTERPAPLSIGWRGTGIAEVPRASEGREPPVVQTDLLSPEGHTIRPQPPKPGITLEDVIWGFGERLRRLEKQQEQHDGTLRRLVHGSSGGGHGTEAD